MSAAEGQIVAADETGIAAGATRLAAGDLVAFPTETVYGLGADATNDRAVATIFAAKGRPRFNPLIVHLPNQGAAAQLVIFGRLAQQLAERFWPGPLTLVLPRRPDCSISLLCSAGLDTLAVRVPAHPVAQALLAACGLPLAAPSANASGQISPTTAQHVAGSLGDKVSLIIDGGACQLGLESTVVDLSGPAPRLLRPGGLTREDIEAEIGPLEQAVEGAPRAPGMLESHYAPGLPLRLNARDVAPDEALIAFGPEVPQGAAETVNLSVAV